MNGKTRKAFACVIAGLLAFLMLFGLIAPVFAADAEVQYGQTEARSMLDLINAFRTGSEAYYWNEDNTGYVDSKGDPLSYSYALEEIAMIRAAELTESFSHTRPDGTRCFTATAADGTRSWGENIAYGYPTAQSVFMGWREDNDDYSGQGHRRNMLNTSFKAVGVGHAILNGTHYWVQEFGYDLDSTPYSAPVDGVPGGTGTDPAPNPDPNPGTTVASGTCGENLTWTLNTDGVLTISGTGEMNSSWNYEMPWYPHRSKIKQVVVESGAASISDRAFYTFDNITSISLPDTLLSIGMNSFADCTSLKEVDIPDSVTTIMNGAFTGCTALTRASVPNSVTTLSIGIFGGCTSLKEVTLSDGLTTIGASMFSGCTALTGVEIPGSVTAIEQQAFRNCTGLTGITIPDSVTVIGVNVFQNCENLAAVSLPQNLTSLGEDIFRECTSLTSILIPGSLSSVSSSAFSGCTSLTEAVILDTVDTIRSQAFAECTALRTVTIPVSVTKINFAAFQSCTSLTDVYYGGTEEQWNAVSVASNNECLLNANIHYAGSGEPAVTKIESVSTAVSGDVLTVTVTARAASDGNYLLCAAVYDNNGVQLDMQIRETDLTAEMSETDLNLAGADAVRVRVFLMDTGFVPVAPCQEYHV